MATCLLFLSLSTLYGAHNIVHAQNEPEEEQEVDLFALEAEQERKKNMIKWRNHKSVTQIFSVKFPEKYQYKVYPLQLTPKDIVFSTEVNSSIKSLNTNDVASVIIKATQTFGVELGLPDVIRILKDETKRYTQTAKAIGGKLISNLDIDQHGFKGKEFYIAYQDKTGKKNGMRIRILLTKYSKIEQVIVGPITSLYSYRLGDFYNSLRPSDTRIEQENPSGVGWIEHPSNFKSFTALLPPKNKDYTLHPPRFYPDTKQRSERMSYAIKDPVLNRKVFFNVTSYKLNETVTPAKAKQVLFNNHIKTLIPNADLKKIETENTIIDDEVKMTMNLVIQPPKTLPYIKFVALEIVYKGDQMLVKEYLCGAHHQPMKIHKTLFSLINFHPKKFKLTETP